MKPFRSIRWRLVLIFVLFTLLTVSVVGTLALRIFERHAHRQAIEGLEASADSLAREVYSLMYPVPDRVELSRLARTAAFFGDVRVRVLDSGDRVLVDSGLPDTFGGLFLINPPHDLDDFPEFDFDFSQFVVFNTEPEFLKEHWNYPVLGNLPPGTSVTVIHRDESPWGGELTFEAIPVPEEIALYIAPTVEVEVPRSDLIVTVPVGELEDPVGYVELSAPKDFPTETLDAVSRALLLGGGVAVLLAGLVGFGISHRLSLPLRSLRETAVQMGAGDLSARSAVHTRDEIGELATQFNQMAEQLEASFHQLESERDALRRFIADASHELRTPITALRNFKTLLLDSAEDDSAVRQEFLIESQAQLDRLERITRNSLDLTRLDAGLLDLDIAEHDLRDLVEAGVTTFQSLADEKGIILQVELPGEPVYLRCDRLRIEMALSNLLDNALKYTPVGGQVETGVEGTAETIRVWVRDTGPGIPPEDLPHIFERFYRGQGQVDEGVGLGLAIVESVVQAHGGEVTVESALGEGACFTLMWK
jgi:signal transduction histidine kinase